MGTLRPLRALELLLWAGALLGTGALLVARRRSRARGLPPGPGRLLEASPRRSGTRCSPSTLDLAALVEEVFGPLAARGTRLRVNPAVPRALGDDRSLRAAADAVEEAAAPGHGWRLRLVLPRPPAVEPAGGEPTFV